MTTTQRACVFSGARPTLIATRKSLSPRATVGLSRYVPWRLLDLNTPLPAGRLTPNPPGSLYLYCNNIALFSILLPRGRAAWGPDTGQTTWIAPPVFPDTFFSSPFLATIYIGFSKTFHTRQEKHIRVTCHKRRTIFALQLIYFLLMSRFEAKAWKSF